MYGCQQILLNSDKEIRRVLEFIYLEVNKNKLTNFSFVSKGNKFIGKFDYSIFGNVDSSFTLPAKL